MITSINEFKKYLSSQKKINEGGGAGINFILKKSEDGKQPISIYLTVDIKKINGKIKVLSSEVIDDGTEDAFIDMTGYDDGGINFKADGLFDTKLNISDDKFQKVTNKLFIDDLDSTLFNALKNGDTASIGFNYYVDLEEMKFAGYIRGKLEEGDVLFDSNSVHLYDLEIEISINNNDEEIYYTTDDDISDTDLKFIKDAVFPEYKVTKKFMDLYNLLFNNDDGIKTNIVDIIYGDLEDYPFIQKAIDEQLESKIEKLHDLYDIDPESAEVKKLQNEIVDEILEKVKYDEDFLDYIDSLKNDLLDEYR